MSLPQGLQVKALDEPVIFVALKKLLERLSLFFQGVEMPHTAKLLIEGAEKAFATAVAFGLADKGR